MKRIKSYRLKAGALQYTVFISVIIALLVFAFIGTVYLYKRQGTSTLLYQELIEANRFAQRIACSQEMTSNEFKELSWAKNRDIELGLEKRNWGIYELALSKASLGAYQLQKAGLLGGRSSSRTALYLPDENRPLVMVGDAHVEGIVKLPKKGVKRGSISGRSYYGEQLIYGDQQVSATHMPKVKDLDAIKDFRENWRFKLDWILNENMDNNELKVSFFEPTQVIDHTSPLILDEVNLQGNVLISSDSLIVVGPTSRIYDAILMAPRIIVKSGFTGSIQAFASERILIESASQLDYPSALVLQPIGLEEVASLTISESAAIKGTILILNHREKNDKAPQLLLENGSKLVGEVYNEGSTELHGTILGTIMTKTFHTKSRGGLYRNHLMDGTVISRLLPQEFCGLHLPETEKAVAKWLY